MTTKEAYDALICKPDLHSIPELYDNILIWKLYKNAYVQAYCDNGNTCIDIVGGSMLTGSLMHWHPDETDVIDELYSLGKKGNLLVLKKSLFCTSTFYIGPSENYPLSDRSRFHFGMKKWDGGRLVYLEQT